MPKAAPSHHSSIPCSEDPDLRIIGISAFYHDSAAALVVDGHIVAAAQEERFTRRKHDPGFPAQALAYCLSAGGLRLSEVDHVVYYDKPFLKFERLLETYLAFAPRGFASFSKAMPVWLREKLFLKSLLLKKLKTVDADFTDAAKLLFTEHHLSHAASAFYPSPFEEAAVLTMDGVGEWATTSFAVGQGRDLKVQRELVISIDRRNTLIFVGKMECWDDIQASDIFYR